MVFSIIAIIVSVVIATLLLVYSLNEGSVLALMVSIVFGYSSVLIAGVMVTKYAESRAYKALIQSHLENPTYYTYSQLAEHNSFVAATKVWQGTIFSFYNDVDLESIDIDSISQKVIIENKK